MAAGEVLLGRVWLGFMAVARGNFLVWPQHSPCKVDVETFPGWRGSVEDAGRLAACFPARYYMFIMNKDSIR